MVCQYVSVCMSSLGSGLFFFGSGQQTHLISGLCSKHSVRCRQLTTTGKDHGNDSNVLLSPLCRPPVLLSNDSSSCLRNGRKCNQMTFLSSQVSKKNVYKFRKISTILSYMSTKVMIKLFLSPFLYFHFSNSFRNSIEPSFWHLPKMDARGQRCM